MSSRTNKVIFLRDPQDVDSPNVTNATVSRKFSDRPRGRKVNENVVRGCTEFSVPDMKPKQLEAMYPKEYNSFRSMKYERCGKDGKNICHPDINTFPKFLAAFGPKPDPDYTIDRLDPNDLTYGPGKCEWAPKQRQAENKTNNKYLTTLDGTHLHVSEWSRRSGIQRKTILRRVNDLGWTVDDAVGVKVGGRRFSTLR